MTNSQTQVNQTGEGQPKIQSKGLSEELASQVEEPKGGAEVGVGNEAGAPEGGSQKITVDYGGAQREIDVAELVEAHRNREETEAEKKLLEKTVSKYGTAMALHELFEGLSDENRETLGSILSQMKDGSYQANGHAQAQDDEGEGSLDDEIDRVLSGQRQRQQPKQAAQDPRLDRIEQFVNHLAQERHQQSLDQRVRAEMDSYPVFRENEHGTRFAKDAILKEIALSGGQADIGKVVAKAAGDLHKMYDGTLQKVIPQTGNASGSFPIDIPSPERAPTGADMETGKLFQDLLAKFRSA